MFRSFLLIALLFVIADNSRASESWESGPSNCRGLRTYNISRSISIFSDHALKSMSEINDSKRVLDNKMSYFEDDDGSWGLTISSLGDSAAHDESLYLFCAPSRDGKCKNKITTRLWNLFFKIAEMRVVGETNLGFYEIDMELVTSVSISRIAYGITKFWIQRDPVTQCLKSYARDEKKPNRPLVPFNLSIFAGRKGSGIKNVSVWRIAPDELYEPLSSIQTSEYLGEQSFK